MPTGPSPSPSWTSRPLVHRAILLLWAVVALFAVLVSAERIDRPFPGFLISANLYLGATDLADWTGSRAGLLPLDRIVSIDGEVLRDANHLIARVAEKPAGTPFRYVLGDGRTLTVPSMPFTWWEFARSALPFWIAGVVHLGFGGWVLMQRPHLPAAVGHWRYCQVFALFLLAGVFGERWPIANVFNLVGCGLMLPGLVELALAFPARLADSRMESRLRRLAWAAGGAIALLVLASLVYEPWFPLAFNMVLIPPILAMLACLGLWAWQAFFSRLPATARGQARMALVGMALSLGPSVVYSIAALMKHPLPGFEFAFLGFCGFPAAVAFAIVRYQAFDLNYVLRRATFYTLLTGGLGGIYLAAAMAGHQVLGRLGSDHGGVSVAGFLTALAVAAAFRPAHDALHRMVDRWFLGDRLDPLVTVAAFTADTERLETDALGTHLVCSVREALGADWVILRWNGREASAGGYPAGAVPAAELVLRPSEGPIGTLEVGPRGGDLPYGPEERALLNVLASQAALALDRAMLFESRLALGIREATAIGRAEAHEHLVKQVVHDLGTELSNIAVSADLARQMPGAPGPIDSIQASLGRIEQFLAEKRERLHVEGRDRTAVATGLEAAIATLTPQLALRQQRLETRVADREVVVPLSEIELAQVIVNVVGNASKFSPAGTGIRLAANRQAEQVLIVVEDEGPGVPETILDTLGDGRRAHTEVPGDGFGLQNCRALVTAAGGTLEWYNGPRGAVVELKLPVVLTAES